MKKILLLFRNIVLIVAIFIVSMMIMIISSGNKLASADLIPAAAGSLTIIAVFVWSKISKRYL